MAKSEQDKIIDEWVAEKNSRAGEIKIPRIGEYPVDLDNWGGCQMNEWVTTDTIRHYVDCIGDRNPLFRFEEYAKGTRWGGIIGPPTITDTIVRAGAQKVEPEAFRKKLKAFSKSPWGSKRELFRVIRPGDRIRVIQRNLGLKEIESERGGGVREFLETTRRSLINQREELVANDDGILDVVINYVVEKGQAITSGRKRYRLTDEERDAIERGYDEETRRGAKTLFWEDVSIGDALKMHDVGPHAVYDSVAYEVGAIPGHVLAYDVEHERIKVRRPWHYLDPELNAWTSSGICHFNDNKGHADMWTGGLATGYGSQVEGLITRMICDWMGDDGFVKSLTFDSHSHTIIGDVYRIKGKVTKKYIDNGEHVIDLELWSHNAHDSYLIAHGSGTVRLASRTDTQG